MSYKIWVYHKSDEPKQIDYKECETYKKEGWEDSPLKCDGFIEKKDIALAIKQGVEGAIKYLGLTEKKARALLISQIGEKVQYVTDEMNDLINKKTTIKKHIRDLAKKIKIEFNENVCVSQYKNSEGFRKLKEYYSELENGKSK